MKIAAATGALLAGFACGLWGCGEPSPEPYIELLKSTHSDEREEGAYELLRLGPAAVPRLLEELDSPSSQVRYIVVQLLGRLRDQRAVPFLVAALEDRSAVVAGKAAWSLAELRIPRPCRRCWRWPTTAPPSAAGTPSGPWGSATPTTGNRC